VAAPLRDHEPSLRRDLREAALEVEEDRLQRVQVGAVVGRGDDGERHVRERPRLAHLPAALGHAGALEELRRTRLHLPQGIVFRRLLGDRRIEQDHPGDVARIGAREHLQVEPAQRVPDEDPGRRNAHGGEELVQAHRHILRRHRSRLLHRQAPA
jgi:hypothetical protein